MKSFIATTVVASAVLVAGWAYAQDRGGMGGDMPMMQGMSDQMMGQCRMTMGAELSPRDPAVLLGMKEELELTDQQVEQLQTLADETRQKAAAVLNNAQRQEVEQLPQQPQSMMQMHQQMMGRMQGMEGGMGHMQGRMQGQGNMDMCSMMMRMMRGGHGMHGGQGGMMAPATQPAEQVELDAEAQASVDRLVSSYLTIQQRLAQDQSEGVAAQFAQVRQSAQALSDGGNAQLQAKAEAVAEAAQAQPENLEQARAAFKELSAAVIGLTQVAAPSDRAASALYVANCPMASASWLQTSKQIVNPYMGQRMLRCGSVQQTVKAPSAEAQE